MVPSDRRVNSILLTIFNRIKSLVYAHLQNDDEEEEECLQKNNNQCYDSAVNNNVGENNK